MRWVSGLVLSATVLAGCQTSGYTSGQSVRVDCAQSPIQLTNPPAALGPDRECSRKAAGGANLTGYMHYRYFEMPGVWYAKVVYTEALGNTYLTYVDGPTSARGFKDVQDIATNWRGDNRAEFGGNVYRMTAFEMGPSKCIAWASHIGPKPSTPGYAERIAGHMCGREVTYATAEKFLSALKVSHPR